jgi:hypothetical protein
MKGITVDAASMQGTCTEISDTFFLRKGGAYCILCDRHRLPAWSYMLWKLPLGSREVPAILRSIAYRCAESAAKREAGPKRWERVRWQLHINILTVCMHRKKSVPS